MTAAAIATINRAIELEPVAASDEADVAVLQIIETPAGERPLRLVVDPVMIATTMKPSAANEPKIRTVLRNEKSFRVMSEARNNGVPLIEQAPRAGITQSIRSMATALCGSEATAPESGKSKGRWLSLFSSKK